MFDHRNREGIPDTSVIVLGAAAAILAAFGSLQTLVETASLAFLFTFTTVCFLAVREKTGSRFITGFGAAAGTLAFFALIVRLSSRDPLALIFLGVLVIMTIVLRHILIRTQRTD